MGSGWAYGGVQLSADLALVELTAITTEEPPSLLLETRKTDGRTGSWVHHWIIESEVTLSFASFDGAYVLRFGDGSLFEYDRSDRTIRCPPRLDRSVRHQLLDHVLPRVLDDLGHLMIHGAAITTPNGAVIFIGDTGHGKSTLAASFQGAGIQLLSDDCMRLTVDADGGVSSIPTYRSLRLWPDSADAVMPTAPFEPMAQHSDKRLLDLPPAPPSDQTAVAAVCVLANPNENSGAVTLASLAPARAVALLLAQCFRLDPTDAEATRRAFEQCADVVERVPVVELSYLRDYDRLPEVREAVLQRAASGDWATVSSP